MGRGSGWQVEGIFNFVPNVVSFLLTPDLRRWYIIGAYVSPNKTPTVYHEDQDLESATRRVEVILLGDLNVRLRELRNKREEELATKLADSWLANMIAHFMPRRRYREGRCWTWRMRQEGRKVTDRGDYVLSTDRHNFSNAGVREAKLHTDQRMVLVVLRGEGVLRHCRQ